jgi:hypothetical protein
MSITMLRIRWLTGLPARAVPALRLGSEPTCAKGFAWCVAEATP